MDWFSDIFDYITGFWIHLKYLIAIALCGIVRALYKFFEIFAGLVPVTYQKKDAKLINVFFYNQAVTNAYWGMCLIGIAMAFGFALIAVIRKMFDLGGRNQQTMGSIIGNLLRSVFFMLSLSFGMMIVLDFSDKLMNQITYLFDNASSIHLEKSYTFKDEELSAMARVLNTIGNYSMNASYNSRYNLNACYNEIRPEMEWLQKQGVFDFTYQRKNEKGETVNTWQNALQRIAEVKRLSEPERADVYNEQLATALMDIMEIIRTDKNFKPIKTYVRNDMQKYSQKNGVPLDRMCFLAGTMDAAINEEFNKNPSLTDSLRGRFYVDSSAGGDRSIYNYADVLACFHPSEIDFLYIWLTSLFMAAELLAIVGNCVARIFNVIFLYLIAPPFFASWPLDNGGKAKQWLTAFLIQNFSVFATVMSVRVVQIFIPIVTSADLVIVDWTTWGGTWAEMNWAAPLDYLAKLMMILIAFMTARKASGVVTGILADSAGWQAIGAADSIGQAMRGMVGKASGKAVGMLGQGAKSFLGGGKGGGKGAGGGAGGGEGGEGGEGGGAEGGGGAGGGEGGGSLPSKSNLGGGGSGGGAGGKAGGGAAAGGGAGGGAAAGAGGGAAGGAAAVGGAAANKVGGAVGNMASSATGKGGGGAGGKSGGGGAAPKPLNAATGGKAGGAAGGGAGGGAAAGGGGAVGGGGGAGGGGKGGVLASMAQDFAEYTASGLLSAATGSDVNVSFDNHWGGGDGEQGPPPPSSSNDEDDELMPEETGDDGGYSDDGGSGGPGNGPGSGPGSGPASVDLPEIGKEFNASNAQPGQTVNLQGQNVQMPPKPVDIPKM